ncbi:2-dehydro-3-deoxygluconokinase [Paenibacillus selenitireducens]|uniref:2-dehydro-3-deoxygluconokinase n=1 Tax=Paenibacillus selenitireducens TaxID=1324314 RepID=A0A1T2X7G8_9BACL|nr:sugar kinase [Paenibacillus selenitireducens]OPA75782.1 2-dehydro-3-deoxygluconokinase [Paenibacillus selenitireducens]
MERNDRSLDVITFGESMALFMPAGSKGIAYSSQFERLFGGAESNVAIGLARLGHAVGWCGSLGADPFGKIIAKTLRSEGVDVSRVKFSSEASTGLMFREVVAGKSSVYYYRRDSAASRMKPTDLDSSYFAGAKVLHITGITAALSESCRETLKESIRIAKQQGVKVCFDPNLRLKLWSIDEARSVLLELAAEADYFLPGLDELKLLYQTDDFHSIIDKLKALPGVCVIKGGDDETYLLDGGELSSIPYFNVDRVIDTVGAGDGFCAGFIAGIVRGLPLAESVRLGNLIGSMVIQMEGDWEALPTWEEADAVLNNIQHIER